MRYKYMIGTPPDVHGTTWGNPEPSSASQQHLHVYKSDILRSIRFFSMFDASNEFDKLNDFVSWTAWNYRKRKEDFKHVEVELFTWNDGLHAQEMCLMLPCVNLPPKQHAVEANVCMFVFLDQQSVSRLNVTYHMLYQNICHALKWAWYKFWLLLLL